MKMSHSQAKDISKLLGALKALPVLEEGCENGHSDNVLCLYLGNDDQGGSMDHEVAIPVALAGPVLAAVKHVITAALKEAGIEPG